MPFVYIIVRCLSRLVNISSVSPFGFKLDNIRLIKYQTGFSPKMQDIVTYAYLRVSTDHQDLDKILQAGIPLSS